MPSPLHPALVHFPIVLILLGTLVALPAAFTPRWHLRWIAAVLLALGAIGAVAASVTGEDDGEAVERQPGVESVLEIHEEWAERTQGFGLAAAGCALAAALVTLRWPRVAQGVGIAGAAVALFAAFCVFQAGHYGGQLVYRHGAGVNLAPSNANAVNDVSSSTDASVDRTRDDHAADDDHR